MRARLLLQTSLHSVLVPGAVLLYVPYRVLHRYAQPINPHFDGGGILACLLVLIGVGIYLRCAWDFVYTGLGTPAHLAPPSRFVGTGLYRWMRNPMYQGVLLQLFGLACLYADIGMLRYSVGAGLCLHLLVTLVEEPILRRKFGASYLRYCQTVPRWGIRLASNSANQG